MSSTVSHAQARKNRMKKTDFSPESGSECEFRPIRSERVSEGDASSRLPQEGEADFFETNCHWKGCHKEFESQEELVRVSIGFCDWLIQICVLVTCCLIGPF